MTSQPSLWDNVALESGYHRLAELKFAEAIREFSEAAGGAGADDQEIKTCMAAATYWTGRIDASPSAATARLLEDYRAFSFTGKMNAFKKSLLLRIIDLAGPQAELQPSVFRMAFDLLLSVRAFGAAEDLASVYARQHPESPALGYLLGKAQWLNENKMEAYRSYAAALVRSPAESLTENPEPSGLKELISHYGPYMAPAYGWITGLLPFVETKDIPVPKDPAHRQALLCYDLLQKVQKSFGKAAKSKEHLAFRKELQKQDGALFKAYLDRVNQD
jgi:hypothetical protein